MVLNVVTSAVIIINQKLGKSLYVFVILTYMPEYGFSTTRIFPFKYGSQKTHLLQSVRYTQDIHLQITSVPGLWVRCVQIYMHLVSQKSKLIDNLKS